MTAEEEAILFAELQVVIWSGVGVGLGVFATLVLAGWLICVCCRRRRAAKVAPYRRQTRAENLELSNIDTAPAQEPLLAGANPDLGSNITLRSVRADVHTPFLGTGSDSESETTAAEIEREMAFFKRDREYQLMNIAKTLDSLETERRSLTTGFATLAKELAAVASEQSALAAELAALPAPTEEPPTEEPPTEEPPTEQATEPATTPEPKKKKVSFSL
jgi:hypothetical protein